MNAIALTISNVLVRQDDQGRYCLNDLHKAAGGEKRHQPSDWLRIQQTQELVFELENHEPGIPGTKKAVETIQGKGKAQGTYAVKELVYAYAMWISAKFHIAVIRAYDAMVTSHSPQTAETPTLTKAQIGELFNRVSVIASGSGKIRAEVWSRFQNHFKLASYKDLPADQYDDAIAYLDAKQAEYLGEGVEMLYLSNKELEAKIAERVKALEGELLTQGDPATSQTDTVIRIGLDGGIKYMMLSLHGTADAPSRFLVDVSRSSVYINSVQQEALALTERDFIDFLVKERGYIVVKKTEIAAKLMA